jgi:predicted phosphohydrolase
MERIILMGGWRFSGYHLEKILDNIGLLIDGCCGCQRILIMPIPRFWIACCAHARSASVEETEADRKRLLRELGRLRRAVSIW